MRNGQPTPPISYKNIHGTFLAGSCPGTKMRVMRTPVLVILYNRPHAVHIDGADNRLSNATHLGPCVGYLPELKSTGVVPSTYSLACFRPKVRMEYS